MQGSGMYLIRGKEERNPSMNKKLTHIALVLGSMRMGGAERASLNLINALVEKGLHCDLILVNKEGEFLTEVNPEVNIIDLGSRRTLFSAFSFKRYLKMTPPQVIIAGQTHVQLMVLRARKQTAPNIPVILNEHSTFSTNHPLRSWKSRILRFMARRWFPRADAITAVSQGVAEDLAGMIPALKKKLHVIYNPVLNSTLRELSRESPQLPWSEEDRVPFILGAGRLVKDKDFQMLLRAVAQVRRSKKVRLVILGEGEEHEPLLKLARELNFGEDFSLQGYTKNPYAWMRMASLFVLSSRREGLPMVLIEALACGCKVISTDCPSGPKEILGNGKYGTLVPVGDVDALAEAITAAMEKPSLNEVAEEALRPFEANKVADDYMELMLELLENE